MTEPASTQDYALEYLRGYFELLEDEDEGIAHWLALMDLSIEEWRFDDSQMLLRLIKGFNLSPYAVGQVHQAAGDLCRWQRAWEEAALSYQQALESFRRLEKRADEAMVLNNMALALQEQGCYEEAISCYDEAAAIYRQLDDLEGLGQVLSNLGSVADAQGDWRNAIRYYRQGAEALEKIGAEQGLARVFNNLGVAHDLLNQRDESFRQPGSAICQASSVGEGSQLLPLGFGDLP